MSNIAGIYVLKKQQHPQDELTDPQDDRALVADRRTSNLWPDMPDLLIYTFILSNANIHTS